MLTLNYLFLRADCIRDLDTQFPESHRVQRLKGMHLESLGKTREAQHIYDAVLKEDPTNSLVSKRKIAILRSENKLPDAINQLGIYLKTYMNDMEAWQELCDLYLKVQDYAKAAHTMEELVVTHPHHHLYQQRYADILYTMGGLDNVGEFRYTAIGSAYLVNFQPFFNLIPHFRNLKKYITDRRTDRRTYRQTDRRTNGQTLL